MFAKDSAFMISNVFNKLPPSDGRSVGGTLSPDTFWLAADNQVTPILNGRLQW